MKIFKRKFKVKVTHFRGGKYKVKFAYYRFIPIYHSLCSWLELSLTGDWSTELFDLEEAEIVAKSLKSIEGVREWYKPYEEEERIFYKRKEEYYKNNIPYESKHF